VPIAALTQAHYLACPRACRSESSTYRALRWLEQRGFLRRRKLRLGPNRFRVIIDLQVGRFKFFLRQRHTSSHMHPQLSEKQFDDLLNNPSNLQVPTSNYSATTAKSNSHTTEHQEHDRKDPGQHLGHNQHPVRYTCQIVLENAADRAALLRRIDAELAGATDQCAVAWQYWTPARWYQMPHNEREAYAVVELIPALRRVLDPKSLAISSNHTTEPVAELGELVPPGDLSALVNVLCGQLEDQADDLEYTPSPVTEAPFDMEDRDELQKINDELAWKRKNLGIG
jgi:hypothetical protein